MESNLDRKLVNQQSNLDETVKRLLNKDLQRLNAEILSIHATNTKKNSELKAIEDRLNKKFEGKLAWLETKLVSKVKDQDVE
jgi:uncharacterized membrane protein YgaE (UPF0421/DUF939 family)